MCQPACLPARPPPACLPARPPAHPPACPSPLPRQCSNVLLSEDMRASVGDLGSALFLGSAAAASAVGFSSTHAAPEALLGQRCSLAADIYSLGILLIELTTLTPVVKRGGWRLPTAPQDCPLAVAQLIGECIAADPAARPCAAAVQQRRAAMPD